MNLFGVMKTSGGAMQAERIRAEIVAANMANAETTRTAEGGPYRRQQVVFAADSGDAQFADSYAAAPANFSAASFGLGKAGIGVAPGVHVAQVITDPSPPLMRYDPGHPDADRNGYVAYPDINPVTEMVDLMGAARAYELNGSAVQAEKGMIASALEIVKV